MMFLTYCMLDNFSFLLFYRLLLLLFFFFLNLNSLGNTIRVSNRLDSDQDKHFLGLNLGPTCAKDISR